MRLAREVIERLNSIGRVEVEGEVHGVKAYASGTSFTLRERGSRISVWWSAGARNQGECRVREGEQARVVGRLIWAHDRGSLQLAAEQALPTGAGAVAELIAEAREKLRAAGLLDRPRRPLPVLPRLVGVIVGREAAVKRDIESVVAQRWPGYPLRFEEVGVSGPSAPLAIAEALAKLGAVPEVDVIILARGGGDATDLLPWSNEELCRAVAACPVPVVSAIGHEEDRPLCDELADLRCGTPSLAAGAVIPDPVALRDLVGRRLETAASTCRRHAEARRSRLVALAPARALDHRLQAAQNRVARLGDTVEHRHPRGRVSTAYQLLQSLEREREALSPVRVLDRGYAVVRSAAGGPAVRRPSEVRPGEAIEITLAGGTLAATAGEPVGVGEPVSLGETGE